MTEPKKQEQPSKPTISQNLSMDEVCLWVGRLYLDKCIAERELRKAFSVVEAMQQQAQKGKEGNE